MCVVCTCTHAHIHEHTHTRTCSPSTLLLGDRTRPLISPSTTRKDKGMHLSIFSPVCILFPEVRLSIHHLPLKPTGQAPCSGAVDALRASALMGVLCLERPVGGGRRRRRKPCLKSSPGPSVRGCRRGTGPRSWATRLGTREPTRLRRTALLSARESPARKPGVRPAIWGHLRGEAGRPGEAAGCGRPSWGICGVRPAILGNLWGEASHPGASGG